MRVRKSGVAAVIALAGALVLAGCGGSGKNAASRTGSPGSGGTGATEAQLHGALLTVGDLPTGWAEDTSQEKADATESSTSSCVKGATRAPVHSYFEASQGATPAVSEELAGFPDVAAATAAFANARAALASCDSFKANGYTFKVGPLSLPQQGDESIGLRASTTAKQGSLSVHVSADACAARAGSVAVFVGLLDVGTPDDQQLAELCGKAVSKVRDAGLG